MTDQTDTAQPFGEWCILELMGHRRLAGYVREVQLAGAGFLRLDIPEAGTDPARTQLIAPGSVYALHPVSEDTARRAAGRWRPEPVHRWELAAVPATVHPDHDDEDLDDEDPDAPEPLDLDALKALEQAATPAPWHRAKEHSLSRVDYPDNAIGNWSGEYARCVSYSGTGDGEEADADAKLIVAARNALPELLAKLEKYRATLIAAENDLLNVRGILSPNGYEPKTPLPLAPTVAPAVAWLVGEVERLNAELAKVTGERDQLRYERRLLGFARRVLDLVAEGHNHGYAPEYIRDEAADIAQRIVDEIGHPVTDEPALGPSFREQIATLTGERDDALQVLADMTPAAYPTDRGQAAVDA